VTFSFEMLSRQVEDAQVAELAAAWQPEPSIAWHIVGVYAYQRQGDLQAAVDALRRLDLDLDQANVEVGEA